MLGFSEEEVEGAFPIKGEPQFSASSGPIWVRLKQRSSNYLPHDVIAKGCIGTESSISDCNVSFREKLQRIKDEFYLVLLSFGI